MSDDDLRRLYADAMPRVNPAGCPTPEQLRDAVVRTGSESGRLATMDHIAGCPACRAEFDLMRAVAQAERKEGGSRFRGSRLMGMAAAAVLAFGVALIWRASRPEPIRGPADPVRLIAPGERWSGGSPLRFVWSSTGAGTVYVFELVDSAGRARYSVTTDDTVATLPDTLALAPAAAYRWWVRARRSDGQEVSSSLRRLEVTPP